MKALQGPLATPQGVTTPRLALLQAAWLAAPLLAALLGACSRGGGGGGALAPEASASAMSVTPNVAYSGFGIQGSSAGPTAIQYLIKSVGNAPLNWTAASTESWSLISPSSGTLEVDEEVLVTMQLDQGQVRRLPVGLITGSIDFTNIDNDAGSTSRGLNLDIEAAAQPFLSITPDEDFIASGLRGGPFNPASKLYTLKNEGSEAVDWIAQASIPALGFDVAAGSLGAGETQLVEVRLDQVAASLLGIGDHYESFSFSIPSSTSAALVQTVSVRVLPATSGSTSQSLTQFGITWSFDQPYEVGQFANGDWWVKGPVTIVDISPRSDSLQERRSNGSMKNPSAQNGTSQGYDSTTYAQYKGPGTYKDQLNLALNVSASSPVILPADSSLVSTISRTPANLRPQTGGAAILTVLGQAPPPGAFRPAYSSLDKSILFNEAQLNYSKLGNLARPPLTPDLGQVERWFLRPWIDHVPLWVGRYVHPSENMPDYGREIADQIGTATLMLNLDFSSAEKRDLLVRIVQLGIDLHGIYQREGKNAWRPFGGHMSGRKWPILFAGLMLDDASMSSVGLDPEAEFSEDGQTFYVAETSPGVYNFGEGGYSAADVGLPEYGSYHSTRPSYDDKDWFGDPYRLCCTANVWWGQLLSAYIMGARDLWNYEALFDYQDRFLSENQARGIQDYRLSWTAFPLAMWKAYRSDY